MPPSKLSKVTEDSDMMSENAALSISIALGDHNFPDLAQFALGSDSESENDSFPEAPAVGPSTATWPRLSLNDILNPASESGGPEHDSETDYLGSKLDVVAVDGDGFGIEGSVSSPSESWHDGPGSQLSDVPVASVVESQISAMDTDQAYDFDERTSLRQGSMDTSSGGDFMDIDYDHGDNRGITPISAPQLKAPSTLQSFFQPKNELKNSDSTDRANPAKIKTREESRHLKRPRVLSDTDSNASDESENYRMRKGKVGRSEGKSRSAKASRARREKLHRGELTINEASFEQWKRKILADDPNIEFDPTNIRLVRHSTCGRDVLMKEACDAMRWRTHLKDCKVSGKKKKPSAGMPTLMRMGFTKLDEKKSVENVDKRTHSGDHQSIPCPGISEANDPRVPSYLRRTSALGGGARSVKVIAGEIYNKLFTVLEKKAKQDVLDRQQHEHKWKNDHNNLRVFAVACKRTVAVTRALKVPLPCSECTRVLSSKSFKTALQKPSPEDKNYIYTNHRFRSPLLGQIYARSIGLKELIENPVNF